MRGSLSRRGPGAAATGKRATVSPSCVLAASNKSMFHTYGRYSFGVHVTGFRHDRRCSRSVSPTRRSSAEEQGRAAEIRLLLRSFAQAWWSSPTRSCGQSVATTRIPQITGYLEWFKPGTESRLHEAGYAANRCTHDLLEPKTGSVASTEDASPPRRYPR